MFITIRSKTDGDPTIRKIIDADEILFIEKIHAQDQLHGYKVQIHFKKNQHILVVGFGDGEELQYFFEEIHRLLNSENVKLAPAKEVRELNHLIEDE